MNEDRARKIRRIQNEIRVLMQQVIALKEENEATSRESAVVPVVQEPKTPLLSMSPVLTPVVQQAALKPAAQFKPSDENDRETALCDGRQAGAYVLLFGKHCGERIDALPLTYVMWLAGFRRRGREFSRVMDTEQHAYVSKNHPMAMASASTFLRGRCWVCGSLNVKYLNSKLCTSCWFDNE